MIDFWAIIGRTVTDSSIRTDLFNAFAGSSYPVDDKQRAAIPAPEYDRARNMLKQQTNDIPLSLMALGEIVFAVTQEQFRTRMGVLADRIGARAAASAIVLTARTTEFYAALGSMILDDQLRIFLTTTHEYEQNGFVGLSIRDKQDLDLILGGTSVDNPVVSAAEQVCNVCWSEDCYAKFFYWGVHKHPIATVN